MRNTIVVNSLGGENCAGTISSQGNNLSNTAACFPNNPTNGDIVNATPGLAPLALNAPGKTKTHALLATSPAIDGVTVFPTDCGPSIDAATDQREVQRPQYRTAARCDIGAFELEGNNPPTISGIAAQQVDEDRPLPVFAFTVADAEAPLGKLTVTGTSSNPKLVPNGGIILSGSGESWTATITPAANQSGVAQITLTVNDGTTTLNTTASTTFSLTVSAVNDPPVNSVPGPQSTIDGTPLRFTAANGNLISVSESISETARSGLR